MEQLFSLNVKCPYCEKSLMDPENKINDKPSILLKIEIDDKSSFIRLSSIYGSYNHKSDLSIPERVIARFYCPHCDRQLVTKMECEECRAPMVSLNVIKGGKVIICSRKGCKKHYIAFEELSPSLKKFHNDNGLEAN